MQWRVLIIDDDPETVALLNMLFSKQGGYLVYAAYNGREGLRMAYEVQPHLILLDVMMPEIDGFTLCEQLRQMTEAPILMLTARVGERDVVQGLNKGADDYVRKPFHPDELMARVRALLRRVDGHQKDRIWHYHDGILEIDLRSQVARVRGEELRLSATEYRLLECLVRRPGVTVPYQDILRYVWGNTYPSKNLVSLYVYYLRQKLAVCDNGHQYIQSDWGRGYRFVPWRRVDGGQKGNVNGGTTVQLESAAEAVEE